MYEATKTERKWLKKELMHKYLYLKQINANLKTEVKRSRGREANLRLQNEELRRMLNDYLKSLKEESQ